MVLINLVQINRLRVPLSCLIKNPFCFCKTVEGIISRGQWNEETSVRWREFVRSCQRRQSVFITRSLLASVGKGIAAGELGAGQIVIKKGISLFSFETTQGRTDRGVSLVGAQLAPGMFGKIFARQEPDALNSEKCSQCGQNSAPPQDRHRHSRIFRFALDAGVGENSKDEREQ